MSLCCNIWWSLSRKLISKEGEGHFEHPEGISKDMLQLMPRHRSKMLRNPTYFQHAQSHLLLDYLVFFEKLHYGIVAISQQIPTIIISSIFI